MLIQSLHICLVGGSAEYPSRTLACLDFLAQHLNSLGGTARIWDLAQNPLPLFNACSYADSDAFSEERVSELTRLADQADAFVWASPVYHNSFSGMLKNMLDTLSIQQFSHKPVAIVSCGNSERTGCQPCDHLQIVARGLHAIAIPTQLVTLPTDFTRAQGHYLLTNEETRERARLLAEELLMYASVLRTARTEMSRSLCPL
jgi:NAD(P)H-dependent FMN reductase